MSLDRKPSNLRIIIVFHGRRCFFIKKQTIMFPLSGRKIYCSLPFFIITGEEVLHEGWSSYDNFVDNCHGVRRKTIVYTANTHVKMLIFVFKSEF
jgi:hypothetical protein